MKTFLRTALIIVIIFVLALAVDQITPLKQLTLYLNEHPDPYRAITIGMTLLGWVMLIGAFAFGFWIKSQPMREDEARRYMQTSAGQPHLSRRFAGQAAGREFRMAATFREVKDTLRAGGWLHELEWWPIILGLMALPLIAYGMFGYFFVIGAPLVKLFCAGALVYATLRTMWGFWKA